MRKHAILLGLLLSFPAQGEVTVTFCANNPGCLCIDWSSGFSSYIEVRCDDGDHGWTQDDGGSNPDGGTGSWAGDGSADGASDPHPGGPLAPALNFEVQGAKGDALNALADMECCVPGTNRPYPVPTECNTLFDNNPLHTSGYNLLKDYVIFRSGEGHKDGQGEVPCDKGYSAWTKCCGHSPYIFICNNFDGMARSEQAVLLIHEVMHVAGQFEDTDGSVGPGDPPNRHQISEQIRQACGL